MRKIGTLGILLVLLFANLSAFAIDIDQIVADGRDITVILMRIKNHYFTVFLLLKNISDHHLLKVILLKKFYLV